jgi:hypothetical protein
MGYLFLAILFIFTKQLSHCFESKNMESFIPLDLNNVLIKLNQDYKLIKNATFDFKTRDFNLLNDYKKFNSFKNTPNISVDCSKQIANFYKALDQKELWAQKSKQKLKLN